MDSLRMKEAVMTPIQVRMADFYERLADVGLPKSFVRKQGLPDWWCDEYEASEGAIVTAAAHVSKKFNLDFDSLLDGKAAPRFIVGVQPKYKLQSNIEPQTLTLVSAIAVKVADVVAFACKTPYQPIDGLSAAVIRAEILNSRQVVDLVGLLDFCWGRGIPVVYFDRYPQPAQFQGMVVYCQQRPVIVLSLVQALPSQAAMIVAHELGHILNGHLSMMLESLLIDEIVVREIDALSSQDDDEITVNHVMSQLVLEEMIAPSEATHLAESGIDVSCQINHYLLDRLDWDRLGNDYQEYLEVALDLDRV
jgi:hypothetical protein